MKRLGRTDGRQDVKAAGTRDINVVVRTCITPRCTNATHTFYCDECWERQQEEPRQTA